MDRRGDRWSDRRWTRLGAAVAGLALIGSGLATTQARAEVDPPSGPSVPAGFTHTTAIGGIAQPVAVAFAPDGTAFIGLQIGLIKSYDYDAETGEWEPFETSTEFADLTEQVNNYSDRGLTGIAVDPEFPDRPYVYVNYTLNKDPSTGAYPAWGDGGEYDDCGVGGADEANIAKPGAPEYRRGCPVMDRVSRLTAVREELGWVMTEEVVLVEDGCAQFASHSSGDVTFGPDGMLYASAGEGASFREADYGQANDVGYAEGPACPGDPVNEGGSTRAQDYRTMGDPDTDPLGIDGTIFRLDPDVPLDPATDDPVDWLVAYGQRNPWRMTFRQAPGDRGDDELWSVDVGSSRWEEINKLADAPDTSVINRGWPCYEGTTGASLINPTWQALELPICEDLYAEGVGEVQEPVYSYETRTNAKPLTPDETCVVRSSSLSGIAFAPLSTDWPAEYQDALFFADYLRGCIWWLGKDAEGEPDPSSVNLFVETAGAPVDLTPGPGGDLYYVDYGSFDDDGYINGSGGVRKIDYVGPEDPGPEDPGTGNPGAVDPGTDQPVTPVAFSTLRVKTKPAKVRVKVDGTRRKAPYRELLEAGTQVKLVAPKNVRKKGVRYVFARWNGVAGKAKRKRVVTIVIGKESVAVWAVYRRVQPRQK